MLIANRIQTAATVCGGNYYGRQNDVATAQIYFPDYVLVRFIADKKLTENAACAICYHSILLGKC